MPPKVIQLNAIVKRRAMNDMPVYGRVLWIGPGSGRHTNKTYALIFWGIGCKRTQVLIDNLEECPEEELNEAFRKMGGG